MDLCNQSCSSIWPAVFSSCMGNFNVGHNMQFLQPNLFIPGMHIGNSRHCFLAYYTFLGDGDDCWMVTRSAQSKASSPHFLSHFSPDQDKIWCGVETVQVGHPNTFQLELINHGNNFFWQCKKQANPVQLWHPFGCLRTMSVHDDRYCWTLHFETTPSNLHLDSRSQGYDRANPCVPIILQSSQLI